MTPDAHEYHHAHPAKGYAYFSPVTNIYLEHSGALEALERVIEAAAGKKAILVPAAA